MTAKAPKKKRGIYTKPNIWDQAGKLKMFRGVEAIDPGAIYFIAILNQLGLDTQYSCEGHPNAFYVMFMAPYKVALKIKKAGYFSVEIEGQDYWSIRISRPQEEAERVDCLRWAADAWERLLGPLKLEEVRLT